MRGIEVLPAVKVAEQNLPDSSTMGSRCIQSRIWVNGCQTKRRSNWAMEFTLEGSL